MWDVWACMCVGRDAAGAHGPAYSSGVLFFPPSPPLPPNARRVLVSRDGLISPLNSSHGTLFFLLYVSSQAPCLLLPVSSGQIATGVLTGHHRAS